MAVTAASAAPTGQWTRLTGEEAACRGTSMGMEELGDPGRILGEGGAPGKFRLISPLGRFGLWAPEQPLVHPSLAHRSPQVDHDPYRCCHAHDCCYGRLEELGCEPKLEKYLFSVSKRGIFCGRWTALK